MPKMVIRGSCNDDMQQAEVLKFNINNKIHIDSIIHFLGNHDQNKSKVAIIRIF